MSVPRFRWGLRRRINTPSTGGGSTVVDFGGYRPQMFRSYGMKTVGGRGSSGTPTIIRINTLDPEVALTSNADGTYSGGLRAALTFNGPRFVVPEVSGYITVSSNYIQSTAPYMTFAGQCAPAPGLSIRGGGNDGCIEFADTAHDIVIQHMRVRNDHSTSDFTSAMVAWNYTVEPYNIVFDHCSVSFMNDEGYAFKARDCTLWRSIAAFAVQGVLGSNGHGHLVMTSAQRTAMIGCLFAHNVARNPEIHELTKTFVADSVIYDFAHLGNEPAASLIFTGGSTGEILASYENVQFIKGPTMSSGEYGVFVWDNIADVQVFVSTTCSVSTEVNLYGHNSTTNPSVSSSPIPYPDGYVSIASSGLETFVLANAGARPLDRDRIDSSVVTDVTNRVGTYITNPADIGGHSTLAANFSSFAVPANPWGIADTNGRTNMEAYLETLALAVEEP